MRERLAGENTPAETRRDANAIVDREKRYKQIISIMTDCTNPMTAKEIAVLMYERRYTGSTDRNHSSPRLTELMEKGIVEPAGKVKCKWTGRTVTAYRLREEA